MKLNKMLELPKEADIVIIGGGFSGCSMAYYLSKGGMKVVLIEQRSICSGASGRNGGEIVQVDGRDLDIPRVKLRSKYTFANNKLLEGLEEELDIDMEYRQIGSLDIANSEEDWEDVNNCYKIQREAGDSEIEIYGLEEAREKFVWALGDIVRGVKYRPSDGQLSPFALTYGYAREAIKLGAKIFTETKAIEILKKDGKAIGVKTDRGEIHVNNWVINATNAWSKDLIPELDIIPCKTLVGITEQVPLITLIPFESTLEGGLVYGTQTRTGNLLVGGPPGEKLSEQGHFDENVTFADLKTTINIFVKVFPKLKDVSVLRVWSGTLAFTADVLPYIGPVPGVDNLFINAGYPVGISWCPICGMLASEYILNKGKTSLSIEPFDPARFYDTKHKWPEKYDYLSLQKVISDWLE